MTPSTFAAFIYAVGLVESGWRCDLALGEAGELGPLQITPAVIQDLNRRGVHDAAGRPWLHLRCREAGYSIEVARAYLGMVAPGGSAETWARIWRKGPSGRHSVTAGKYWLSVRRVMMKRHGTTNLEEKRL